VGKEASIDALVSDAWELMLETEAEAKEEAGGPEAIPVEPVELASCTKSKELAGDPLTVMTKP
jgi:hypothetical protein